MAWNRWAYMDHWSTLTPVGRQHPVFNRSHVERYLRQLEALRFTGFDTFATRLPAYAEIYGSVRSFNEVLIDYGFVGITGIFHCYPYATDYRAPHRIETHDRIVQDFERIADEIDGLGVENIVVMPTATYFQAGTESPDHIEVTAELWNRVGAVLKPRGLELGCHFEFWGSIRTEAEIARFFQFAEPDLVGFFCDTAQHTIAGVDPVRMFELYRDRCKGFHFKDTHDLDVDDSFRTPPDPELMAPRVKRWFHEMGTPEGLVDFPKLMQAIVESDFEGWLTVEHDKADIGGDYAESTCVARWYMDNVLASATQG